MLDEYIVVIAVGIALGIGGGLLIHAIVVLPALRAEDPSDGVWPLRASEAYAQLGRYRSVCSRNRQPLTMWYLSIACQVIAATGVVTWIFVFPAQWM